MLVGFQGDWLGDERDRATRPWVERAARDLGALARGRRRRRDRPRPDDRRTSTRWSARGRALVDAGARRRSWHHRPRDRPRPRPRSRPRRRRADPRLRPLRRPGRARRRRCASAATRSGCATRRRRRSTGSSSAVAASRSSLLAVVARLAIAGIGPFPASVVAAVDADGDGAGRHADGHERRARRAGQTTCRVTDPADRDGGTGAVRPEPADRARRDASRSARRSTELGHRRSATSPSSAAPRDRTRATATRPRAGYADELAFALALAARAGAVLMDRYERLERIDYKSARDVVTEADHLSEALILDAIRARYPDDAILAEETGEHRAMAGEAPTSGARPGLDRRPARRDRELRQRHPVLLRLDRRSSSTAGRPSGVVHDPTRARDVRGHGRRPGDARRAAPIRRLGQGQAVATSSISMALNGRAVATRDRNVRKAIRISRSMGSAALALAYVAQRPVRRVHPAGRPVGLGRRRGRAHRRARRRDA